MWKPLHPSIVSRPKIIWNTLTYNLRRIQEEYWRENSCRDSFFFRITGHFCDWRFNRVEVVSTIWPFFWKTTKMTFFFGNLIFFEIVIRLFDQMLHNDLWLVVISTVNRDAHTVVELAEAMSSNAASNSPEGKNWIVDTSVRIQQFSQV